MNWDRAVCRGQGDVMFADDPSAAKALCRKCPLRSACLGVALHEDISYGVWGGKDFEERTKMCPICRAAKAPDALGCTGPHSLARLAQLVQQESDGDRTVSVSIRSKATAPTSPGCMQPRGRSHSTANAYRRGCRCAPAREALAAERARRPKPAAKRAKMAARDRFMTFVEIDSEHWWWRGSTNGTGYGNFWDGSRTVRAHLFAITTFGDAYTSRHCREKLCVKPRERAA